jgi:hypothetical protein
MNKRRTYPDIIQTILARPLNGAGGGIPLTHGEVVILFLDNYAGDVGSPPARGGVAKGRGGGRFLDFRSQGYSKDDDWGGLTYDDVLDNTEELPGEATFVWTKWEPLELWFDS